jgi:hypothetical protein
MVLIFGELGAIRALSNDFTVQPQSDTPSTSAVAINCFPKRASPL